MCPLHESEARNKKRKASDESTHWSCGEHCIVAFDSNPVVHKLSEATVPTRTDPWILRTTRHSRWMRYQRTRAGVSLPTCYRA